jgi:hypothetical protein
MDQFDRVQPGTPWYFWFEEKGYGGVREQVVRRVVRDGSGGLWVSHDGRGVSLDAKLAETCLGPVEPFRGGGPSDCR